MEKLGRKESNNKTNKQNKKTKKRKWSNEGREQKGRGDGGGHEEKLAYLFQSPLTKTRKMAATTACLAKEDKMPCFHSVCSSKRQPTHARERQRLKTHNFRSDGARLSDSQRDSQSTRARTAESTELSSEAAVGLRRCYYEQESKRFRYSVKQSCF